MDSTYIRVAYNFYFIANLQIQELFFPTFLFLNTTGAHTFYLYHRIILKVKDGMSIIDIESPQLKKYMMKKIVFLIIAIIIIIIYVVVATLLYSSHKHPFRLQAKTYRIERRDEYFHVFLEFIYIFSSYVVHIHFFFALFFPIICMN